MSFGFGGGLEPFFLLVLVGFGFSLVICSGLDFFSRQEHLVFALQISEFHFLMHLPLHRIFIFFPTEVGSESFHSILVQMQKYTNGNRLFFLVIFPFSCA